MRTRPNKESKHPIYQSILMTNDVFNPLIDEVQLHFLQKYYALLSDADKAIIKGLPNQSIAAIVDGRGLACPMPLLKTKVALKNLDEGSSIYVLATDPNSQHDLAAFCRQLELQMPLSTKTTAPLSQKMPSESSDKNGRSEKLDTIFHVIITKTHGN